MRIVLALAALMIIAGLVCFSAAVQFASFSAALGADARFHAVSTVYGYLGWVLVGAGAMLMLWSMRKMRR